MGNFPVGPVVKTLSSTAGGMDSIPGLGAKIPSTCLAAEKPKNVKQKQQCNKFNKDVKNGPHLSKSERKTPIQYINAHIWNLERW